jgi:fatty-acyl-CoA synthase
MMQWPLLISSLLVHAERHHGEQEIVSRRVEGDIHRTTFRELAARSRRMANALAPARREARRPRRHAGLERLSPPRGLLRRVGLGRGAAHAQPAPAPDQLSYIANHAEDQVLFFDLTFLPLVEAVASR